MFRFYVLVFAVALAPCVSLAQTVQLTAHNNWKAFEILTQGDDISSITDSASGYGSTATRGKYDGLGVYRSGSNSLSIWINHETELAAISRLEVNRANLMQAVASTIDGGATSFPTGINTGIGYAYDAIYDASYHATTNASPVATGTTDVAAYGNSNFDRFCSGTSYNPNSFGTGKGFTDNIYITGEEVGGGKFYALDESTRDLWEADALGTGSWENAALVDTGNTTHVALILSSDVGSSPGDYLQMYVGQKNVDSNGDGSIDFLERNGLRGGSVYYFDPDGAASITDLPDGSVSGKWSDSTAGALQETKLEDIHTNPNNGNQVVFAGQRDGVYVLDQTLVFNGSGLDTASSALMINQIDDDDTGALGPSDNVTWSANGKIYVEEDGGGDGIFQIDPDGSNLLQIANAASEPSGIIDVSEFVGYEAGGVFLTSVQGNSNLPAQLVVLVAPGASLSVPEPGSIAMLVCLGLGLVTRRKRS